MKQLAIVIPVFNDGDSLSQLLAELPLEFSASHTRLAKVFLIDDASTNDLSKIDFPKGLDIELIRLNRNVGHQKAIAIGLAYIADKHEDAFDFIQVMDADGEDRPDQIQYLIEAASKQSGKLVFAKRRKRSEGLIFSLFYLLYKIAFRLMTGIKMGYGNFSVIPQSLLRQIAGNPDIWNHYSGAIVKSTLPYEAVELDRGKRYAGGSKMNFTALVNHGLSAISIHLETVIARILILSVALVFASLIAMLVVVLIKYMTTMAIPGWATNLFMGLLIIIFQSFITSLLLLFFTLYNRTQLKFTPIRHYQELILTIIPIK